MNKEIASIKKRLKTQLEHKQRYLRYIDNYTIDWKRETQEMVNEKCEKYEKEADKCDKIIETLQKEFILAVGRCSVVMNTEAIKAQWDMIVKGIERDL